MSDFGALALISDVPYRKADKHSKIKEPYLSHGTFIYENERTIS